MDIKPQLLLTRTVFSNNTTIGNLSLNGKHFCHTLEDTVRKNKIEHKTAIPSGLYEMTVNVSGRFGYSPLLLNVPFYDGIRIHWGSTDADTSGCILVGNTKAVDFIGESRIAYGLLMDQLIPLKMLGSIWIQIVGGIPQSEFNLKVA